MQKEEGIWGFGRESFAASVVSNDYRTKLSLTSGQSATTPAVTPAAAHPSRQPGPWLILERSAKT